MNTRQAHAVKTMKDWCEANYSNGADTMVECWADEDYLDLYNEMGTLRKAMSMLSRVASIYKDRQDDARNSAF